MKMVQAGMVLAMVLVSAVVFNGSASAAQPENDRYYHSWYISSAGSDSTGDGSEGNPWATFQYAIDSAVHDDSVVALPGTYTGSGNRNITTDGKRIIVTSQWGTDSTTIDAEMATYGFVMNGSGEDTTTVIDDLRIINASYGIYGNSVAPKIQNCHLDACSTGIHVQRGIVRDCEMVGNSVSGIWIPSNVAIVYINRCRVDSNGTGLYSQLAFSAPDHVRIDSCDFTDNYVGLYGSFELRNTTVDGGNFGVVGSTGHLIDMFDCTFHGIEDTVLKTSEVTTMTNCTIRNNSGMIAYTGCNARLYLDSCDIYSNTGEGLVTYVDCGDWALINMNYCLYHSNSAGISYLSNQSVAGIYGIHADHCTVVNNDDYGFNIWTIGGSGTNLSITNSIVAFNSGWGISCEAGNDIACNNSVGNGSGNWTPDYLGVDGNISVDPLFCDTSSGDYTISSASQCAPANNSCGVFMGSEVIGCTLSGTEIAIVRPIIAEAVLAGVEYPIQWAKGADIAVVHVELSTNLGSDWNRLATGIDSEEMTWVVQDTQETDLALIRILDASKGLGGDTTSGPFHVEPRPLDPPDDEFSSPSDTSGLPIGGDFDDIFKSRNNGITDLAFAYSDGRIEIHYGYPDGSFDSLPTLLYQADSGITDWKAADMNNDGSLDLILAYAETDTVKVVLADEMGGFRAADPYVDAMVQTNQRGDPINPILIGVADFTRDGFQDVWVLSGSGNLMYVFENDGSGGLGLYYTDAMPLPPTAAVAADLNGDDVVDLAISCGAEGWVFIGENTCTDFSWDGWEVTYVEASDMIATDFNADDMLDIGIVSASPTYPDFVTLVNNGSLDFDVETYEGSCASGGWAAVADLTGDGFADVAVTCPDNDQMAIFPGLPMYEPDTSGRPHLGYPLLVSPGDNPQHVLVGDYNNDNIADLLVSNTGSLNTVMFQGTTESEVSTDLTLTEPDPNELWHVDSLRIITWTKGEGILAVNISLSRDSGLTWETVANNVMGESFSWLVTGPGTIVSLIRISDASVPSRVDVVDGVFTIIPTFGFESFEVVANASGLLDPPVSGALASMGFPTPGDADPGSDQQVGAGSWAFHTADNGGSGGGGTRDTYEDFLVRSMRGDNAYWADENDFEMRFTGTSPGNGGSWAIAAFTDESAIWVPFELWRIGKCTPDDDYDDVRMSVLILESDTAHFYDLENWGYPGDGGGGYEHSASGALDDPYTDWIYWILPADSSVGESGYLADEAAIMAGTYEYEGEETIGRTVLINVNGGNNPPFNQDLPETGTIFRLVTEKDDGCSCCEIMGDVDHNGSEPDIADLIYMVTYMFQEGPPPPCATANPPDCPDHYYAETDINGDGSCDPDIADLIYLVTYMFQEGPDPAPCQ